MLRENGPFRLIVNYNKQTVSRIAHRRAEFNIVLDGIKGRLWGLLQYGLPMSFLGVHVFFIQQVGGIESGIDIKLPFCSLAAKLRKGSEVGGWGSS